MIKEKPEILAQLEIGINLDGCGKDHSTGKLISVLLLMEKQEDRPGIIAQVSKNLGFNLKDIEREYTKDLCEVCGLAVSKHKDGVLC